MNPHDEDEVIDIVDEHDRVLKTMWRSYAVKNNINYRRIVLAFLVNEQKQLAFLRRTPHKEYAPLKLALVGGGVRSGEAYEQALKREVFEEINIDINNHVYRKLGYVRPEEDVIGCFKTIYEITLTTREISYNPDDFCEVKWMEAHEILEQLAKEDILAPGTESWFRRYYVGG